MGRNDKLNMSFADMVDQGQATHYAGNFFYKHLAEIWQEQRLSVVGLNDSDLDTGERLKHLDILQDLLEMHQEMLEPMVEEKDTVAVYNKEDDVYEQKPILAKLREINGQLQTITGGSELFMLADSPQKLAAVKRKMSELRALLWKLQFKYGMMMPNKSDKEDPKTLFA